MAEEDASPRTSTDDDGRHKRTGTLWTASVSIISDVIGPGVLCLPWAIDQLGWIAGLAVMVLLSSVTCFTSSLLSKCYRSGDSAVGERNYSYKGAVRSFFGDNKVPVFVLVLYLNFFFICVGCVVQGSISMMEIIRSICFHKSEGKDPCHMNSDIYMALFGAVTIIFSLIPNLGGLYLRLVLFVAAFITYSTIGLGFSIRKVIANRAFRGSLTGKNLHNMTLYKLLKDCESLAIMACIHQQSPKFTETQDTLRSPPEESKTMKYAAFIGVGVTSCFFMLCGCFGYAATGDSSPTFLLTGFDFHDPYWLLDIANAAIVVHLLVEYQVYCRPLFDFIERHAADRFPHNCFFNGDFKVQIPIPGFLPYNLTPFKLVWRTIFVIITTFIAMVLPFFPEIVGLLGALGYWPLTVYFPVEMYIVQKRESMQKWSTKWICLKVLSIVFLIISIAAAAGSIAGIVQNFQTHKPFRG